MLRQDPNPGCAELVRNAQPLPPFVAAETVPARPSGGRRRARKAPATDALGGGAERIGGAAPALAVVPSASDGANGQPGDPESGGNDGGPPDGPRALGYSVEALNREYATVKVGDRTVIYQENPTARLASHRMRMLGIDAFKTWFQNRPTEVRGHGGHVKRTTWANRWLQDPARRQFEGLEFFPDPNNTPGSPQYLNLWSGFAVAAAPAPDWRKYKTFRDHLLHNVCGGDEQLFAWVFGFFAHIVQRPRERLGVALVLRGGQGVGKTKVGETIGALFPRHWMLVDSPRYVTGQFNAHMASCLLLQADEAVWAGDKAAEGRLKGLITSSTQFIEAKGIDPVELANYVRLIMTSNEDWVVPAGKDERRYAVLDVDPRCAKNADYFAEIDAEMAAGGLAHLLGDLLAFNLASVDLRNAPRTDALLEQKIRSLGSVDSWWFERLMSGSVSRHSSKWPDAVPCQQLFDDYVAVAEKIGIRRKREQIAFGMALGKFMPGLRRAKRVAAIDDGHGISMQRTWCYLLPSLSEARGSFERAVEQSVDWPVESELDADETIKGENDEFVA